MIPVVIFTKASPMKRRRIFDCFTFFNERDLLRLRIEWLRDLVDIFVIAEGARTFTGNARTPEFRPEDYDIPAHKIRYVLVDDLEGPGCDAWSNERVQRNALLRGLGDVGDVDLVHVSDVDEIPALEAFDGYNNYWVCAHLDQRLYYYHFNSLVVEAGTDKPVKWTRAKITTGRYLKAFWGTPDNLRRKVLLKRNLWNRLRFRLTHKIIADGGWHWSYMMTPERISEKIKAFSHTEFAGEDFASVDSIRGRVAGLVDPFDRGFKIRRVSVSEEFPTKLSVLIDKNFASHIRS